MNKTKNPKKIEYLISLFFNTSRLIKDKSCCDDYFSIHKNHFTMLRLEVVHLIEAEKPTMKRIAEYLHIKAPSATSLVNSLVKEDYIKRETNKDDRRIVQMEITNKGKRFLRKGLRQMSKKIKEVLSKLKQEQIDNFIKIMQEINNAYK